MDNREDAVADLDTFLKKVLGAKAPLSLSETAREALYTTAYHAYENGKYPLARKVFSTLLEQDRSHPKYQLGLAATYQMEKEYEKAAEGFGVATLLDPKNPEPYFHAAECLYSLGRIEDALTLLQTAKSVCLKLPKKDLQFLARIDVLLKIWEQSTQIKK